MHRLLVLYNTLSSRLTTISHIRRLTAEFNSPMPAIDVAHQHLLTARAIHQSMKQEGKAVYETLDWSGIVAGTRVAAGLDGLDSNKVIPAYNSHSAHSLTWQISA